MVKHIMTYVWYIKKIYSVNKGVNIITKNKKHNLLQGTKC